MADAAAAPSAALAPAKLNLYLHVLGRRPDGYHHLDSLVAFADIGDIVSVHPAETLELGVEGPFAAELPSDEDNLVMGAARRLAAEAGVAPRATIRLVKRLPVASGIGGGSADAAAALRLLSLLWRIRPHEDDLRRVAIALGTDVPVCLLGRPAYVGGVGEEIALAPAMPPVALVLANPLVPLPTAAVYKRRFGAFSACARFAATPADAAELACLLATRRNDLTEAACALSPAVEPMLRTLAALPGALLARMSGSGATCFALFAGEEEAGAAARALAAAHPEWWVRATKLRGGN